MKQVLWKGYAFIFCGLQAFSIYHMQWGVKEIAFLLWYIGGCLALIGYAFNIRIAIPMVWKVYFSVLVLAMVVFGAMLAFSVIGGVPSEALRASAILVLPQIPFWYAVWAYAYRSASLWQQSV
jgi:hypothetical protein